MWNEGHRIYFLSVENVEMRKKFMNMKRNLLSYKRSFATRLKASRILS